ncbi:MAG: ABC transporter ATP-binding protein, partial [Proteobacteria bacterium]|nr:ABC transporter ATP-binding protein [Pseudomonadota bacterium]
MLRIEHLGFSYGSTPVLKDISFHLKKGELCGLFGPNGTGKTTLFKCCLKFLSPTSGCIRFKDQDIRSLSTRAMARQVAYVPQAHYSPFAFTAEEMVLMGRTPHLNRFFMPRARDMEKVHQAMEGLGIFHLAPEPYDRLSGGQQQMVLIARAIAQETRVILLDEPAAALDFKNQVNLWKTLKKIADQGTTILACSHDPNHVAWFCHTTVVLGSSGVLAQGDPGLVLCQELMDRIYENTCQVKQLGDLKIIVPQGL